MLRETKRADAIGDSIPRGFSHEVVLALVADAREGDRPSGTAVMISPHSALTATHVIDDYLSMTTTPETNLAIIGRSGFVPEHQNHDWVFNQVVRNDKSDIALLILKNDQPALDGLEYPRLNPVPPEIGDVIVAMGFHSSKTTAGTDDIGSVRIWQDAPTISRGVVFEVYHDGRDKILMPYPCFTADCFVDGGMSGGPVFDVRGCLRGIISRGMAPIDEENYATTAQSVWTSLNLPLTKTPLYSALEYGACLYEAALKGKILTEGLLRLLPTFNEDGSLNTLSLMEKDI